MIHKQALSQEFVPPIQSRTSATGHQPTVFADVYRDEVNIVVWQRVLANELVRSVDQILKEQPTLQVSRVVTPQNAYSAINEALGNTTTTPALAKDVTQLVDMFCCLFGIREAGLRFTVLNRAMCPRFHVDVVPCRLVTTYQGEGTQWLPHHLVDRSKLGMGNNGRPDEQSGLFAAQNDIQTLTSGDVALLKGERWLENEGGGLVHRSPNLPTGSHRLLTTLDFTGN